jgi:hypothetical protein
MGQGLGWDVCPIVLARAAGTGRYLRHGTNILYDIFSIGMFWGVFTSRMLALELIFSPVKSLSKNTLSHLSHCPSASLTGLETLCLLIGTRMIPSKK